jgi:chemotaxis protein histidine kinase CheA
MSNGPVQFIQPRNALRDKIGGKLPAVDPNALARAEAALKSLSGQFQAWMEDEVTKLDAARAAAKAAGHTDKALQDVFSAAHDAKGMGTTYEYPLVTRLAGSLCKLLDNEATRSLAAASPNLIDAHVDAIKAAVRDQIKSDEHPVGRVLANELEGRTLELLKAA